MSARGKFITLEGVDGAGKSIRGLSDSYRRSEYLVELAEAMAGAGDWGGAQEIVREHAAERDGSNEYVQESVRLRWIDHLIVAGDLAGEFGTHVEHARFLRLGEQAARLGDFATCGKASRP